MNATETHTLAEGVRINGLTIEEISETAMPEGWAIFWVDADGHAPFEIQRMDEDEIFDGDQQAWEHVWKKAHDEGSTVHMTALEFVKRFAPQEFEEIRKNCEPTMADV